MNNPTPAYYERQAPAGKLDVYAICKLYEVNDPPIFHAVKKLLRAGRGSGGKSKRQDVSEAIDSLRRYLEMNDSVSSIRVPKVNIRCECREGIVSGSTYLNVIRVDQEDDGSFTAVTDEWPDRQDLQTVQKRHARTPEGVVKQINEGI